MKLLSSSSASSSSTINITTSFDDVDVHTPKSSTAAGCISGMLRRLLCRNSLPTYPSDQLNLETREELVKLVKVPCLKTERGGGASSAPCLVAKLMGLESLPQSKLCGQDKTSNSISRSRSMNSVDALKEIASIQGRYRRVKSFREIPNFVQLEDEEFLILSFEDDDRRTKSEKGCAKTKQSKTEQSRVKSKRRNSGYETNKENQEPFGNVCDENLAMKVITESRRSSKKDLRDDRTLLDFSNMLPSAEDSCRNALAGMQVGHFAKVPEALKAENRTETKRRIRKKTRKGDRLQVKKIEAECDSQNSSPNSVLDDAVFPFDSHITNSVSLIGEHSRLNNSKTRRTLTEDLENYRKLSLVDRKGVISKSTHAKEGKHVRLIRSDHMRHRFTNMWDEICKLAEKETTQSVWSHKGNKKEEFIGELEVKIFDVLLEEVVNSLVD